MNKSIRPKHTLGRLARETGLARASLLNYESLGLLAPAGRSAAGYRLYGDVEIERLRSIRAFREAGLSLAAIRELLQTRSKSPSRPNAMADILEKRLLELSSEIERMRQQQKLLARLLTSPALRRREQRLDKAGWVAMLRRVGMTEEDMRAWHAGFEADDARGHTRFLRELGLPSDEVRRIRRWSRVA